jgi:hypothetical protein
VQLLCEGGGKVACVIFFYFFAGDRWFAKTPDELAKKEKNCTTTCHRPTAFFTALFLNTYPMG